jgi:hypothetical protein
VIEKEYNIPGGNAKEEAIQVFQQEYDHLNFDGFNGMMDQFNNPQNVITFNALKPGPKRDAWVRHVITLSTHTNTSF